jgi:hypothetical protein
MSIRTASKLHWRTKQGQEQRPRNSDTDPKMNDPGLIRHHLVCKENSVAKKNRRQSHRERRIKLLNHESKRQTQQIRAKVRPKSPMPPAREITICRLSWSHKNKRLSGISAASALLRSQGDLPSFCFHRTITGVHLSHHSGRLRAKQRTRDCL